MYQNGRQQAGQWSQAGAGQRNLTGLTQATLAHTINSSNVLDCGKCVSCGSLPTPSGTHSAACSQAACCCVAGGAGIHAGPPHLGLASVTEPSCHACLEGWVCQHHILRLRGTLTSPNLQSNIQSGAQQQHSHAACLSHVWCKTGSKWHAWRALTPPPGLFQGHFHIQCHCRMDFHIQGHCQMETKESLRPSAVLWCQHAGNTRTVHSTYPRYKRHVALESVVRTT